jgi:hypothetical protein
MTRAVAHRAPGNAHQLLHRQTGETGGKPGDAVLKGVRRVRRVEGRRRGSAARDVGTTRRSEVCIALHAALKRPPGRRRHARVAFAEEGPRLQRRLVRQGAAAGRAGRPVRCRHARAHRLRGDEDGAHGRGHEAGQEGARATGPVTPARGSRQRQACPERRDEKAAYAAPNLRHLRRRPIESEDLSGGAAGRAPRDRGKTADTTLVVGLGCGLRVPLKVALGFPAKPQERPKRGPSPVPGEAGRGRPPSPCRGDGATPAAGEGRSCQGRRSRSFTCAKRLRLTGTGSAAPRTTSW